MGVHCTGQCVDQSSLRCEACPSAQDGDRAGNTTIQTLSRWIPSLMPEVYGIIRVS